MAAVFLRLIIFTRPFVFYVSQYQLHKYKSENRSEGVVEHIIKFQKPSSCEILRYLYKYGKRTTQDCRLDDGHPFESVS